MRGLERLKQRAEGNDWHREFMIYQARLLENLSNEKRYDTTETVRSERYRVLDQLNRLAYEHLGKSFNDLCGPIKSSAFALPESQVVVSQRAAFPSRDVWRRGDEVVVQGVRYAAHEPEVSWSDDKSAVSLRVKAQYIEGSGLVWLKQVRLFQTNSNAGKTWKEALEKEGRLLDQLDHLRTFPRRVATNTTPYETTLVYEARQGRTLAEAFGDGASRVDTLFVRPLLRSMEPLCSMLEALHTQREKFAHRMLEPTSILIMNKQRASLQDVGLAALRPVPGEGPSLYRAPEQVRLHPSGARPGPATDVYQLGAILYHLLTGHLSLVSASGVLVAPSEWNPKLPGQLDEVLLRTLHNNPFERGSIGKLARDLRTIVRTM